MKGFAPVEFRDGFRVFLVRAHTVGVLISTLRKIRCQFHLCQHSMLNPPPPRFNELGRTGKPRHETPHQFRSFGENAQNSSVPLSGRKRFERLKETIRAAHPEPDGRRETNTSTPFSLATTPYLDF